MSAEKTRTTHDPKAWPSLPLEAWEPTCDTLHLWTQIVGKTRLALAPMQNHWWQVTLYVTARGLSTSPVPYDDRTFEIEFDFVDHRLAVRTSDGRQEFLPLEPQTVAQFYRRYLDTLRSLGVPARILHPKPNEVQNPVRFDADRMHASYGRIHSRRTGWYDASAGRISACGQPAGSG